MAISEFQWINSVEVPMHGTGYDREVDMGVGLDRAEPSRVWIQYTEFGFDISVSTLAGFEL